MLNAVRTLTIEEWKDSNYSERGSWRVLIREFSGRLNDLLILDGEFDPGSG